MSGPRGLPSFSDADSVFAGGAQPLVFGSWMVRRAGVLSRDLWRYFAIEATRFVERPFSPSNADAALDPPDAAVPLAHLSHVQLRPNPPPTQSPFAWASYSLEVWTVEGGVPELSTPGGDAKPSRKHALRRFVELVPVSDGDLHTWCLAFTWLGVRVMCGGAPVNELSMVPQAVADAHPIVHTPLSSASASPIVDDSASPLAAALVTVPFGAPIGDTTYVIRVHFPALCGFLVFVVDTEDFGRTTVEALAGVLPPTVHDLLESAANFLKATCPVLECGPPGSPSTKLMPFAAYLPRGCYGRADLSGKDTTPLATQHVRALQEVTSSRCALRVVPTGDFLKDTAPLSAVLWSRSVAAPADAAAPARANGTLDVAMLPQRMFSSFTSSVPYNVRRLDAFAKPYQGYCITLRYNDVEWDTDHRHREFKALHARLTEAGHGPYLPPFPSTGHKPSMPPRLPGVTKSSSRVALEKQREEEFLDRRRVRLERYLQQLLSLPASGSSVDLLSWLGILSTSRTDQKKSVLHLSKLQDYARPGDVLLFSCRGVLQGLQRTVTRSAWDHVGIVVLEPDTRTLHLLEVNGDGVGCHPLVWRVRCYGGEFTNCIAVRRLEYKCVCEQLRVQSAKFRRQSRAMAPPAPSVTSPGSSPAARPRSVGSGTVTVTSPLFEAAAGGGGRALTAAASSSACTCGGSMDQDAVSDKLSEFVRTVKGRGYQLNLSKLWKGRRRPAPTTLPTATTPDMDAPPSTPAVADALFCSELVAAALQTAGVMRPCEASSFWPGCFASGGAASDYLVAGVSFAQEVVVDTRELSVSSAITNHS